MGVRTVDSLSIWLSISLFVVEPCHSHHVIVDLVDIADVTVVIDFCSGSSAVFRGNRHPHHQIVATAVADVVDGVALL